MEGISKFIYKVEFHGPQIDSNLQIERFREKIEKKKTQKKKKKAADSLVPYLNYLHTFELWTHLVHEQTSKPDLGTSYQIFLLKDAKRGVRLNFCLLETIQRARALQTVDSFSLDHGFWALCTLNTTVTIFERHSEPYVPQKSAKLMRKPLKIPTTSHERFWFIGLHMW